MGKCRLPRPSKSGCTAAATAASPADFVASAAGAGCAGFASSGARLQAARETQSATIRAARMEGLLRRLRRGRMLRRRAIVVPAGVRLLPCAPTIRARSIVESGDGGGMPRDCLEERSRMPKATPALRSEWSLPVVAVTTALFLAFGKGWLSDLSGSSLRFVLLSAWLFGAMMMSAFGVVRHAETLAEKLGEPFGTLILTLAVTGMEVMMIAALMYSGGDSASMLARDAMFAVVMIVLNGMVGLSLIVGGLRYHEQTYNLQGATAFLAVIMPLAALGLVLPNVTVASPGPTLSGKQSAFLIFMSLVLYGVF